MFAKWGKSASRRIPPHGLCLLVPAAPSVVPARQGGTAWWCASLSAARSGRATVSAKHPWNGSGDVAVSDGGTLWVCDFDGTLYRGWLARFTHGISNTDLFWQVFLRCPGWQRRWRLLKGGHRVHALHRQLLQQRRAGAISSGEVDAQCVQALRQLFCQEANEWQIQHAGEALARGFAPQAATVLQRWLGPTDRVLVLSKAFMPVLLPACLHLSALLNRPVDVVGNRLTGDDGVLRSEDKQRELQAFLEGYSCARAVVIGDTEEDIGMHRTLTDLGIASRLVAMSPKDPRIRAEADLVLPSWRHAMEHPFGE